MSFKVRGGGWGGVSPHRDSQDTFTCSPGSVPQQGFSRFGSLINDLAPVRAFALSLLQGHLWPQRLLGLLVAVATSGTALRGEHKHGSVRSTPRELQSRYRSMLPSSGRIWYPKMGNEQTFAGILIRESISHLDGQEL